MAYKMFMFSITITISISLTFYLSCYASDSEYKPFSAGMHEYGLRGGNLSYLDNDDFDEKLDVISNIKNKEVKFLAEYFIDVNNNYKERINSAKGREIEEIRRDYEDDELHNFFLGGYNRKSDFIRNNSKCTYSTEHIFKIYTPKGKFGDLNNMSPLVIPKYCGFESNDGIIIYSTEQYILPAYKSELSISVCADNFDLPETLNSNTVFNVYNSCEAKIKKSNKKQNQILVRNVKPVKYKEILLENDLNYKNRILTVINSHNDFILRTARLLDKELTLSNKSFRSYQKSLYNAAFMTSSTKMTEEDYFKFIDELSILKLFEHHLRIMNR